MQKWLTFIIANINSIQSQRRIIKEYIFEHSELRRYECIEFKDDGLSGKNDNRPAFAKMIETVRNGDIQCVIVKDMSRFSRDQILCGKYREQIFPFLGVRFIAINDDYDSDKTVGGIGDIDIAFKEILYDMYSEDLSEKVKSSLDTRREKGKFIATSPPYGYKKDEKDKYHLVIDNEAAKVVRRIYRNYRKGLSMTQIRKNLNREGVPCPAKYMYEKGITTLHKDTANKSVWNTTMISRILQNEAYIGYVVSGKYESKETSSKEKIRLPQTEWRVVKGKHRAIIKKEVFDEVHEMINAKKKMVPESAMEQDKQNIFRNLYCKGCGHRLSYTPKGVGRYFCYNRYTDKPHDSCVVSIKREDIENILLAELNKYLENNPDLKKIKVGSKASVDRDIYSLSEEINKKEDQIRKLREELRHSYEEFRSDRISRETYVEIKKRTDAFIKEFENMIVDMTDEKESLEQSKTDLKEGLFGINVSKEITQLDKDLEEVLIDKVEIGEDGSIDIKWKYRMYVF